MNVFYLIFWCLSIFVISHGMVTNFFKTFVNLGAKSIQEEKNAADYFRFGLLVNGILWIFSFTHYVFGLATPSILKIVLSYLTDSNVTSSSPEGVLIAMTLLLLHLIRHGGGFNQQSPHLVNNIQYGAGFVHHALVGLFVVSEAPGFVLGASSSLREHGDLDWVSFEADLLRRTDWSHAVAFLLFIIGQKISSLSLREIFVYSSLAVALGAGNFPGLLMLVWTMTNQLFTNFLI